MSVPGGRPSTDRGTLERLLAGGWLRYVAGFELLLAGVVVAALTLMESTAFRGVIVGMAISLAILTALLVVVLLAAVFLRERLDRG